MNRSLIKSGDFLGDARVGEENGDRKSPLEEGEEGHDDAGDCDGEDFVGDLNRDAYSA